MRDKYVPYDFDQQNYVRLTSLFQGPMTVLGYIVEFDRLTLLCDLDEKEHMKIARFLKGLHNTLERETLLLTPHLRRLANWL